MTNFIDDGQHIHNIARGLLSQGDSFVLCHTKGKEHYFLPGGHIEDGESATEALARELQEELVEVEHSDPEFIGVCESMFPLDGATQHEVNFVFSAELADTFEATSAEDHLEFVTVPKDEFADCNLLPKPLHHGVLDWLESGAVFYEEL